VPERWIREVMRQESGGRSDATSPVGAMGLMQVMPGTYDALRRRHGWATTPTSRATTSWPGAAYLREMHDRFGAPAFLAAYNAGPERVDAVLAGATVLPDETLGYLARVAPRLGMAAELPLPATAYGWQRAGAYASADVGGPTAPVDPADRAFDGGGLVTPWAPTGERTRSGAGSGT
jgi:soluble lytic murein transglycosylase-like protein